MGTIGALLAKALIAIASSPVILEQILKVYLEFKREESNSPEFAVAMTSIRRQLLTLKTEEDIKNVVRKAHELQKL